MKQQAILYKSQTAAEFEYIIIGLSISHPITDVTPFEQELKNSGFVGFVCIDDYSADVKAKAYFNGQSFEKLQPTTISRKIKNSAYSVRYRMRSINN